MADEGGDFIKITVEGEERIIAALKEFPREISKAFTQAGRESATMILEQKGLKQYPPMTAANRPPYPYYERGRGTWTSPARNTGGSENLGKKWYMRKSGSWNYEIGNTASYAKYVHGDKQARAMQPKGWRKLTDVAKEKTTQITEIYSRWVSYVLAKIGR